MSNIRIEQIQFIPEYQIKLFLSNGHKVIYDMTSRIKTIRFMEIENPKEFSKAKIVEGKIIHWNDAVEITLEEILIEIVDGSNYLMGMSAVKNKCMDNNKAKGRMSYEYKRKK